VCRGLVVADLFSIIPEPVRPTHEQLIHMMADWSQKGEPVEIVLDEEADASLCCQHFIDFWENHLWPLVGPPFKRNNPSFSEELYDQMERRALKGYQEFVDELHSTNCKNFLSQEATRDTLDRLENDPRAVERAKERNVRSLDWFVYEFNQCLKGEPFDFTDYVDEDA
jgi:hypothetical protein